MFPFPNHINNPIPPFKGYASFNICLEGRKIRMGMWDNILLLKYNIDAYVLVHVCVSMLSNLRLHTCREDAHLHTQCH
jgi:hypothetical protein